MNAQYKTMFPVDSITWETIMFHSDDDYLGNLVYTGDTIKIDEYKYHKIYGKNNLLVREDTISGKVWLRRENWDTTDMLVMDLNLKLGEGMDNGYGCCFRTDSMFVTKIDTTQNRKIVEFDYRDNYREHDVQLKFIEGIGCNFGFPNSNINVVCNVFHNDERVYSLDSIGFSCPIMYDINTYSATNFVKLFPNPTSSFLQINLKDLSLINSSINLYNIGGRLIQQIKINETATKIDLSSIKPQILIVDIKKGDTHYISKILKQ